MYIRLYVKYPLFLAGFNATRIFSTDFRKSTNFTKIRPLGAELFHAGGQRDGRTEGQT
jgi:hypothetical protein